MGKPLSEETKKKISEALTKNGPKKPEGGDGGFSGTRSPEADLLYREYTAANKTITGIRERQKALAAQSKALGRKKNSKAQRAALQAEIKKLAAQAKEAVKQRQEAVRKATLQRKLKALKATEAKANLRKNEIGRLRQEAVDRAATSKNKDRAKRMADRLATLDKMDKRQDEIVSTSKAKAVEYQSAFMRGETSSRAFAFSEHIHAPEHGYYREVFLDGAFRPFRKLTKQEERVNFYKLNDEFDALQNQIRAELEAQVAAAIDSFNRRAEDKLSAGEIAAIAALYFLLRGGVKKTLGSAAKKAFEAGQISAVDEFNSDLQPFDVAVGAAAVRRATIPSGSKETSQLRQLETEQDAETLISSIENTGKDTIAKGVAAGAATAAIIAAASTEMRAKASKGIEAIASKTVAANINRGRASVFTDNIAEIYGYMRSEVMDAVTCNVCISLDRKVIAPDDPMRTLDQVHTYCRGAWVPIKHGDIDKPEITGIPATLSKTFDKIDGRPITNAFKQLKKPLV